MKKTVHAALMLMTIVACNQKTVQQQDEISQNVNKLFDDYYEKRLQLFPLEATAIADKRYNDQLPVDISDSYRGKLKAFYQKNLEAIAKYDRAALKGQDVLSYDIFKREMQMQMEGLTFKDNLMPVNQFWSMHLTFPQLGSGKGNQPFKTVKDYDDFLKRISAFVVYQDSVNANMRRGMAGGITPHMFAATQRHHRKRCERKLVL